MRLFPPRYTLTKVSKETSSCCYNLEVQAFFCHPVTSGGAPSSSRSVITKEVIARVSALGGNFDVIIKEDDTLTVKAGGTTTTYPRSDDEVFSDWSESHGSPTVLTVSRVGVAWRRGKVFRWTVSFAFGGAVTAWATSRCSGCTYTD